SRDALGADWTGGVAGTHAVTRRMRHPAGSLRMSFEQPAMSGRHSSESCKGAAESGASPRLIPTRRDNWIAMTARLKLYGFPPTRSIRVLWMLRELGVEFEFVNVNLVAGENRRPEFLALNPAGKLP